MNQRRPAPVRTAVTRGAVTCVAALALVACGVDSPEDVEIGNGLEPGAGDAAPGSEAEPGEGEGPASEDGQTAVPGAGPSPASSECVDLAEPVDGQYVVADAGIAAIGQDVDRLVVASVQPAAGWDFLVTDEEGEDVEVEFYREAIGLTLTVGTDDGALVAELCRDDD